MKHHRKTPEVEMTSGNESSVEHTKRGITRRRVLKLTAGTSAAVLLGDLLHASGQTLPAPVQGGAAAPTFRNPLLAGDYSDPSILRVGADFYMTHNSYAYAPALVIWHSRDLVNWLPIAHAVADTRATHGEIWSPEFVEHGGQYFIYFPMDGIHVVHAGSPGGPWSAPISLKLDGIDPGHVVGSDGKRYLYTSGGYVIELSPSGLSTVGTRRKVYDGWDFPPEWKTEGKWLESPKLTKRGDFYYLVCAEGGTAGPPTSHMAIVARSRSPLGPWENSPHNPLIHTYSADEVWWSVGHGTLVSTPDARWYFVYHGYRKDFTTLGRHTLMEPVEWTADGWPRAPLGARRGEPMPAPMGVAQAPMIELSDDFKSPILKGTWGAWKETDMSRFRVGGGALVVRAKGGSYAESSPLTLMARDEGYAVQVVAEIEGKCAAALGLEYNPQVAIRVELKEGSLTVYGPREKLAAHAWPAPTAWLKLVNRKNRVEVLASADGQKWESLATDFDTSNFDQNGQHGGYQAARPALAASGSGSARFRDFRYHRV